MLLPVRLLLVEETGGAQKTAKFKRLLAKQTLSEYNLKPIFWTKNGAANGSGKPFKVTLLGYDGEPKYTTSIGSQCQLDKIYALIETMPMRKLERAYTLL